MTSAFEQIIAIDGASGSGKTTLLRSLSERFSCPVVELGPVVRTVAWIAEQRKKSVADAVAVLVHLESTGRLRIDRPGASRLAASEVELDGHPLRQQLFSGDLGSALAAASVDAEVMSWVHGFVREWLRGRQAVVSAREAASTVCPTAGLRVRLEAAQSTRGARKRLQMAESGLRPVWTDDALLLGGPESAHVVIDTTRLTPSEVSARVVHLAKHRLGWTTSPQRAFAEPRPLVHL